MFIVGKDWTIAVGIQFVLEIILFVYGYHKCIYKKETDTTKLIVKTLFYFYLIAVLFVTLLPLDFQYFELGNFTYWNANNFMRPFEDLVLGRRGALRGIILNTIMLIPFGILYPLVIQKTNVIKCISIGLLFILGIEVSQMLLSLFCIGFRTFDITDVIVNTIGIFIGYIIYKTIFFIKDNISKV